MPKVTVICYTRSQPWGYGHYPRGSRMQQRIRVNVTRPLISMQILNFRRKRGGTIRPDGIFFETCWANSSRGFEGLETFFKKKCFFHLVSSLSSFSLSSSLFTLHSCLVLSFLFHLLLHSCLVSSSAVLSCFLFFCLLLSCLSSAVFSSLSGPVFFLCLCHSLSVSMWCCGRVVVLCCGCGVSCVAP